MAIGLKFLNGSKEGNTVPVSVVKFIIGRETDCSLRLSRDLVSRHHCAIIQDGYTIRLRDLGSKNGTYVNGHKISTDKELSDKDVLTVGGVALQLSLDCVITDTSMEDTNTISLSDTTIHKQDTEITKVALAEEEGEPVPPPITPPENKPTPPGLVTTSGDDDSGAFELEPDDS